MEKKRVRARLESAELGYAKGGSMEKMMRKRAAAKNVAVVVALSVIICVLIVAAIFIGVHLSQKGSSGEKPKSVNVYYGELLIKTDRTLVYDGSNVCIDMNCVRDMLTLTMERSQNEITYSTVNKETIKLTVGENTVIVNGIQFSVASKTKDVQGKIFASAEIVNRFISDTSVTENQKENSVSV